MSHREASACWVIGSILQLPERTGFPREFAGLQIGFHMPMGISGTPGEEPREVGDLLCSFFCLPFHGVAYLNTTILHTISSLLGAMTHLIYRRLYQGALSLISHTVLTTPAQFTAKEIEQQS